MVGATVQNLRGGDSPDTFQSGRGPAHPHPGNGNGGEESRKSLKARQGPAVQGLVRHNRTLLQSQSGNNETQVLTRDHRQDRLGGSRQGPGET